MAFAGKVGSGHWRHRYGAGRHCLVLQTHGVHSIITTLLILHEQHSLVLVSSSNPPLFRMQRLPSFRLEGLDQQERVIVAFEHYKLSTSAERGCPGRSIWTWTVRLVIPLHFQQLHPLLAQHCPQMELGSVDLSALSRCINAARLLRRTAHPHLMPETSMLPKALKGRRAVEVDSRVVGGDLWRFQGVGFT